jgi:hypothetical protein
MLSFWFISTFVVGECVISIFKCVTYVSLISCSRAGMCEAKNPGGGEEDTLCFRGVLPSAYVHLKP